MINKLSFYTALMLCVPLFAWATGWHWVDDSHLVHGFDTFMYFLTESGSAPYALITCVIFMLWLMKLALKHYSWLLVGAVCATSVIGTQAIKTVAKNAFAEPRPYVVQVMGGEAQAEKFYELSRTERGVLLIQHYQNPEFPLVVEHRIGETGYSFPSGHTIFAVSWLLVFAGLLSGIRSQAVIFAQAFAFIWAGLMLISRLRFGMHYPIDLFVSTLIAWAFHCILFVWAIPFAEKFSLFKKRG